MKKKSIVCGVIASSIAVAATFGGCSLVSTNTAADMNRTIATVDISKAAKFNDEFGDYASAVGETNIIKRELVAYFINYGYSVYQQYYATNPDNAYERTFNSLLDQLVDNAVLVQYSTLYLLKEKGEAEADALETYKSLEGEKAKYEYLLGGEDSEDVYIAKYNLYNSINSAIDAQEKKILKEETSSNGTETRTAPTGVDTQKENYYPQKSETDKSLDYKIYTGYAGYTLDESGAYEKDKLEGTNNATRIAAYTKFISNLEDSSYDLVDSKKEDLRDVENLDYIQYEYINQLQQRIINKYYDVYEKKQEDALKDLGTDKPYATLDAYYQNLLDSQTENYQKESNFTSAMDSMSDTSFVLYAPKTDDTDNGKFGYVYNILLPFSEKQSDDLKALQAKYADSDLDGGYKPEYYTERKKLLEEIKTTDQREAWFNGETEYAFNAKDAKVADYFDKDDEKDAWLFFENNVSQPDKYEALDKYAGLYPYNGTVVEREDGGYKLIPEKLNIKTMLDEFVAYIDYVMGDKSTAKTEWHEVDKYSALSADNLYKPDKVNGKDVIDYSNFVYATGKVDFGSATATDNRADLLVKATKDNEASAQYLALSAVNELQYAYTTDTGVLSQYIGYSVQAGDTNYIKEFEHAAHDAVSRGAGSFAVCAGDYGWHLIYVTYTFGVDENQYNPQWAENVDKEGTFENLFYEYYKSQELPNISTKTRNRIITDFKGENTVTKYESAYKNLFELDKNNQG